MTSSRHLYLSNLSTSTKSDSIKKFFKLHQYKDSKVELFVDKSGKSLGCARLTVPHRAADKLLEFNGKDFDGSNIKVTNRKSSESVKTTWTSEKSGVFISNPLKPKTMTVYTIPFRYRTVDVGANLTHKKFKDTSIDPVINRSQQCGVEKIIITCTNIENIKEAAKLAQLHKNYLYYTAGIHPNEVKTWTDKTLPQLTKLAKKPECLAIGDCGLDFKNSTTKDEQLVMFEQQVQLACSLKKTLYIHEREAHNQIIAVLETCTNELPTVVVHGFNGTEKEATKYIEMGFYISFSGLLERDYGVSSSDVLRKSVPEDRILIESSSPNFCPDISLAKDKLTKDSQNILETFCTHNRNEPCSVPSILEIVAHHKDKDPEEYSEIVRNNSYKVFAIPVEEISEEPYDLNYLVWQSGYTEMILLSAIAIYIIGMVLYYCGVIEGLSP